MSVLSILFKYKLTMSNQTRTNCYRKVREIESGSGQGNKGNKGGGVDEVDGGDMSVRVDEARMDTNRFPCCVPFIVLTGQLTIPSHKNWLSRPIN